MKKLTLLVLMLLPLLGCPHTAHCAKVTELRMNITTAETSVWFVAAKEFKRLVEEKTNGRYKISLFGNEQLSGGDQVKGIEMLFTGLTDLDIHSTGVMSGFDPRVNVIQMPWIFPNGHESVDTIFFNGPGAKLFTEIIEQKNVKVLGFGENGFRQLTNSVRPVQSVADMKQMKIRCPPVAMYVEVFKLFGSDPTVLSFSEVFTGLQQRTIDGQENPLDTIRAAKIHEIQKYLSMWNYSYDPIVLCVSSKVWKKLPAEDKRIFEESGKAAMATQIAESRKRDKEMLDLFAKYMEITYLTPEQAAEFQKAAAPIYQTYREKIGEDVFRAFGYTFQ